MKFIIGSTSQRKIQIVEKATGEFFNDVQLQFIGYNASSGVSETPYDKETYDGARNRALDCKKNNEADFYIGIESGLVERYGHIYEEAWCVIIDPNTQEFCGYSSGLKVPDYILKRMKDHNLEHYQVLDMLDKELDLLSRDTWANYSGSLISREVSLEESVRNALVQIVAPEHSLYKK